MDNIRSKNINFIPEKKSTHFVDKNTKYHLWTKYNNILDIFKLQNVLSFGLLHDASLINKKKAEVFVGVWQKSIFLFNLGFCLGCL